LLLADSVAKLPGTDAFGLAVNGLLLPVVWTLKSAGVMTLATGDRIVGVMTFPKATVVPELVFKEFENAVE